MAQNRKGPRRGSSDRQLTEALRSLDRRHQDLEAELAEATALGCSDVVDMLVERLDDVDVLRIVAIRTSEPGWEQARHSVEDVAREFGFGDLLDEPEG